MSVKIYCGKKTLVPQGYGRAGTPFECMRCGFGAAMRKYKWSDADLSPQPPDRPLGQEGCRRGVIPNSDDYKYVDNKHDDGGVDNKHDDSGVDNKHDDGDRSWIRNPVNNRLESSIKYGNHSLFIKIKSPLWWIKLCLSFITVVVFTLYIHYYSKYCWFNSILAGVGLTIIINIMMTWCFDGQQRDGGSFVPIED
jgi:hypothetical protein